MSPQTIRRFKEGDTGAFKTIYNQYSKQVMNYCMTMVLIREHAEELVNDIFLQLWLKRAYLDEERAVGPYLFAMTKHMTFNWLKAAAAKKQRRQQMEVQYQFESEVLAQEKAIAAGIDLQTLEKEIEQMPIQRRRIFKMCRFEEMTYAEVAQALSLSRKTVENQMNLAGKQLARLVKIDDYLLFVVFGLSLGLFI